MTPKNLENQVALPKAIRQHMDTIQRKILVMSGKKGVGKTTVIIELAQALASMGIDTGILDADLSDPSVAKILQEETPFPCMEQTNNPRKISFHLRIADFNAPLEDHARSVVITDLLAYTDWGALDYLFIDTPPGVKEEHLVICQNIPELTGAIIVTTGQASSILDTIRSVVFCRKMGIAILGLIENMGTQKGAYIARKTEIPFLGSLPLKERGHEGINVDQTVSTIAQKLEESMTCSSVSER